MTKKINNKNPKSFKGVDSFSKHFISNVLHQDKFRHIEAQIVFEGPSNKVSGLEKNNLILIDR